MKSSFAESTATSAALAWLEATDWRIDHGPDIAPDEPLAEQRDTLLPGVISSKLRLRATVWERAAQTRATRGQTQAGVKYAERSLQRPDS